MKVGMFCIRWRIKEKRRKMKKIIWTSHEDATSSHSQLYGQEESGMNDVRDSIADGLMAIYQ
jgi:hypothetical protein